MEEHLIKQDTAGQVTVEPAEKQHKEDEYLLQRVFGQMKLTQEQCRISLQADGGDDIHTVQSEYDIFTSDEKGNIRILVYRLSGWVVTYPDPNMGKTYQQSSIRRMLNYYVTRIAPWNLRADSGKYVFPKGQGTYPFFPPSIMRKFADKTPIDTLILTEGYFKAMCASVRGFDIVGLGSVTLYQDSKTRELYPDLRLLINTCKVKKVVLLYDGDCLDISKKDLEAHRDLIRRPKSFYNSVINTRDLLVDFAKLQIEFAYIRTQNLIDMPKGLDDLLLTPFYEDKADEILTDLTEEDINNRYFFRMDVRNQVSRLKRQFYIDSVDSFYKHWEDQLGTDDFVYDRMVYHFDEATNKLERTMPLEIRNYIRVGDDYYEMIKRPVARTGAEELSLVPRKKGTIIDDFGRQSLEKIRKFKAFVNVPSHLDYKPVVGDCFNLYQPINYHAEPGREWGHIRALMEHIFGEQVELGYDYMQLLYKRPMQILPILCLVSHERGTGKTSFLDLLSAIYGNNAVVVGNSEISSEFNALVSGKLVVGVDETSLEDNVKVTERLKMLSTAKNAPMQRKGHDHEIVENFTKYVLCSNNETRFIYTQEDEVRFWVRKVDPIPKDELIPDILPILADEIPGFLSFLEGRKLYVTEPRSRMWFSQEDINTDALVALKAAQLPLPIREIKDTIRSLFLDFPRLDYAISVNVLKCMIESLQRVPSQAVTGYLKNYFNLDTIKNEAGFSKAVRVKIPRHMLDPVSGVVTTYYQDVGKAYLFRAEQFLDARELDYVKSMCNQPGTASVS